MTTRTVLGAACIAAALWWAIRAAARPARVKSTRRPDPITGFQAGGF